MAPDVTPRNAASYLGLFCLLTGFSSKNEIRMNKKNYNMKYHVIVGRFCKLLMGCRVCEKV